MLLLYVKLFSSKIEEVFATAESIKAGVVSVIGAWQVVPDYEFFFIMTPMGKVGRNAVLFKATKSAPP